MAEHCLFETDQCSRQVLNELTIMVDHDQEDHSYATGIQLVVEAMCKALVAGSTEQATRGLVAGST